MNIKNDNVHETDHAWPCPLPKKTRKEVFFDEMNQVVPWSMLVTLIQSHAWRTSGFGRAPAVCNEDHAAHPLLATVVEPERPSHGRGTAGAPAVLAHCGLGRGCTVARRDKQSALSTFVGKTPDCRVGPSRHQRLLLKTGAVVDAGIISALSSAKNKTGQRDLEMHQTRNGNQWHLGMKMHVGVNAESGLVHPVICNAANVNVVINRVGITRHC